MPPTARLYELNDPKALKEARAAMATLKPFTLLKEDPWETLQRELQEAYNSKALRALHNAQSDIILRGSAEAQLGKLPAMFEFGNETAVLPVVKDGHVTFVFKNLKKEKAAAEALAEEIDKKLNVEIEGGMQQLFHDSNSISSQIADFRFTGVARTGSKWVTDSWNNYIWDSKGWAPRARTPEGVFDAARTVEDYIRSPVTLMIDGIAADMGAMDYHVGIKRISERKAEDIEKKMKDLAPEIERLRQYGDLRLKNKGGCNGLNGCYGGFMSSTTAVAEATELSSVLEHSTVANFEHTLSLIKDDQDAGSYEIGALVGAILLDAAATKGAATGAVAAARAARLAKFVARPWETQQVPSPW